VFASWRPWRVLAGAYIFGAIWIGQLHVQAIDLKDFVGSPWLAYKTVELIKSFPTQLLSALPYLATVVVLVLISRNKRLTMMNTPASLGQPFVPDR
jgi:simple sugar transport system permease protein